MLNNDNIHISVNIVGDEQMKKLNKEHKDKDEVTDVLSFNIDEVGDDSYYLGDVIVNKDQAERQAKEYGNDQKQEIAQLVEHGILHLFGIHHDKDK